MVGGYGLGSRNERGDLLVDWCREYRCNKYLIQESSETFIYLEISR